MITIIAIILVLVVGLMFFGTLVQLIGALVVGLIAGALARMILPGRQDMALWQTCLLGVCGSMAAGLVGALLGVGGLGIVGSILGALAVLWGWLRLREKGIL